MTVFGSKRCWTGRVRHLVASFLLVFVVLGETCGAPLNDGWTADGTPVTLPHCWNVVDGADGPTDPKAWNHDSVGGTGYARRKVVYRRDLPPATPGLPRYEFRDDGFYVDGRRTFLKGVCYHQDREGKGWAISAEDEESDIRLIKAMGANAIRTSHYPRSERFYDLCDRYGLYVWTEIPLVDATTDSAAFRANTLRVAREMVLQHRRHRCIAMWGLFNELYLKKMPDGQAEPLVREVQALIRSLDPRPTVAASCRRERKDLHAIPDALGFNLYPGWYGGESSQLGARLDDYRAANGRSCVAVSEYGAGGSLGQTGGDGSRPKHDGKFHPLDYQLRHHVESWNSIKSNPRVWGAFVWQMFDCGSDSRHEGARDGINDKGLVGFDHKTLKPAYEFYRREWNR